MNHIVWQDQGYNQYVVNEDMAINNKTHGAGTVPADRRGLPSAEINYWLKNLGEWQYVVMHKGETEIVVFRETAAKKAKCVISTCHSALRGVGMVRGTKQSGTVQEFYGPESWGDYSNCMRSGVDIGDEYRKMFETSTRAIQKMPPKTLAWHEDVLVDNYYHIYRFWHHDSTYGSNSTNRARVQKYRYMKEALHGILDGYCMRRNRVPRKISKRKHSLMTPSPAVADEADSPISPSVVADATYVEGAAPHKLQTFSRKSPHNPSIMRSGCGSTSCFYQADCKKRSVHSWALGA